MREASYSSKRKIDYLPPIKCLRTECSISALVERMPVRVVYAGIPSWAGRGAGFHLGLFIVSLFYEKKQHDERSFFCTM